MATKRARTEAGTSSGAAPAGRPKITANRSDRNITIPEWIPAAFRETYKIISLAKYEAAKFLDRDTLEEAGLLEAVDELIRKAGWEVFLAQKPAQHPAAIIDFLTTLQVHKDESNPSLEDHISFTFNGQRYTCTFTRLTEIWGFPADGLRYIEGVDRNAMWEVLRDPDYRTPYEPGKTKAQLMRSSELIIIHRALSLSLWGKPGSPGNINIQEMHILYAMVRGIHLNGVRYLLTRFLDVQKNPKNTKTITFGGTITTLLQGLGCRNFGPRAVQGGYIDRTTLINMHVLIRSTNFRNSAHRLATRAEMRRLCGRPGDYAQQPAQQDQPPQPAQAEEHPQPEPQEQQDDRLTRISQQLTELHEGQLELREELRGSQLEIHARLDSMAAEFQQMTATLGELLRRFPAP